MDVKQFDAVAIRASELIQALAHPARLRIACALVSGEASVVHLAGLLGDPEQDVHRHLALLRKERIIRARRKKKRAYYALRDEKLAAVIAAMAQIFLAAHCWGERDGGSHGG